MLLAIAIAQPDAAGSRQFGTKAYQRQDAAGQEHQQSQDSHA
jgi:hypothetical protein